MLHCRSFLFGLDPYANLHFFYAEQYIRQISFHLGTLYRVPWIGYDV